MQTRKKLTRLIGICGMLQQIKVYSSGRAQIFHSNKGSVPFKKSESDDSALVSGLRQYSTVRFITRAISPVFPIDIDTSKSNVVTVT